MSELARRRWRLLGEVLSNHRLCVNEDLVSASVRRFTSFGLISTQVESECQCDQSQWYIYTSPYFPQFCAFIRHADPQVSISDLLGFNNTGNVCVWPSEEVLTYYCLKIANTFRGKKVCELGGGMTSLAAVAVALCSEADEVLLTDGNELSVTNIEKIVSRNMDRFRANTVHSRLLRWAPDTVLGELECHFDYVICADCLFFDEARNDLANVIDRLLKPKGEAVILAPRRGPTLQHFVDIVSDRFAQTQIFDMYDDLVSELHCQNVKKGVECYDEDIHYPLLIRLCKHSDNLRTNSSNTD